MAKQSSTYVCTNCNNETQRWSGKCRQCDAMGTIEEREPQIEKSSAGFKTSGSSKPKQSARSFSELQQKEINRFQTGIGELDRVLGGGFVDGEVVLLAGQPGAGKSTICIQLAEIFANAGKRVLYSSGEESETQIKLRADRLGITNENIKVTHESNMEVLQGHIDEVQPQFVIVDSIQTLASSEIPGSLGSISQSKEAANVLTSIAKSRNITMVLISQVIKTGEFAGSESIQHIVDCGLIFESDSDSPLKFLRATKNRFGSSTEVGIFQHGEKGLEEVSDPSGILLDDDDPLPGEAATFISEGMRQIPVEIQSLVTPSSLTNPRKQFSSVDYQRGQTICAILDKFCKLRLFEQDVFVSTLSGIKVRDPLTDLAVAASIMSSDKELKSTERIMYIGELSLTGKVRGNMIGQRIKEAERLGFDKVVIPKKALTNVPKGSKIKVATIEYVKELKNFL